MMLAAVPIALLGPNPSRSSSSSSTAAGPLLLPPPAAYGMTPADASESYDAYASTYDDIDGGGPASFLGIDDARRALLGDATFVYGNVLEVCAGTGLNLDSYDLLGRGGRRNNIDSLTLVDVSGGMLDVAKGRWEGMVRDVAVLPPFSASDDDAPVDLVPVVEFIRADVTSELVSIFGEDEFDVAIDTFGLCVMGEDGARRCLREMTKVVKRGGE